MAVEHEKAFEDEVCAHLAANGWLYSPNEAGYDKVRALFPEDVLAWLRETQADELSKAPDEGQLLDRLVKPLALVQLRPVTDTGKGAAHDPRLVRLAEVLEKLNELFAGEDFTIAEKQGWAEGVTTVLQADATIQAQARVNSQQQFVESQDLSDKVTEAVLGNQNNHSKMADYFFTDDRLQAEVVKALGRLVYENLRAEA